MVYLKLFSLTQTIKRSFSESEKSIYLNVNIFTTWILHTQIWLCVTNLLPLLQKTMSNLYLCSALKTKMRIPYMQVSFLHCNTRVFKKFHNYFMVTREHWDMQEPRLSQSPCCPGQTWQTMIPSINYDSPLQTKTSI